MKKTVVLVCLLVLCSACIEKETENEKTDFAGPYINMTQYEFSTVMGKPIDFSTISGYDDVDGLLPVKLEGYVNYYKPGEYYPSITCTDLSGNKTAQIITVRVLRKEEVPQSLDFSSQIYIEPKIEGCLKEGTDAEYACSVVPDETVMKYEMIFSESTGFDACVLRVREGTGDTCEEIYTNDGSLWGYGYLKD